MAIVVHVLSLTAGVALVALIGWVFRHDPSLSRSSFVVDVWWYVSGGLVKQASGRVGGATNAMILAAAGVLGEVFYWCLAVPVFGAWIGHALPQRRRIRLALVLAGFASVWFIPLVLSWAVATLLFIKSMTTWPERWFYQLGASCFATVVPAVMFAMSLRLARGLGEGLDAEDADEDRFCENCGYNLHATGFDSRCPECGQSAARSFSSIYRCNGWEVGQKPFVRAAAAVLRNPGRFFRTIRTRVLLNRARRFMLASTLVSAVIFALLAAGRWPKFSTRAISEGLSLGVLLGGLWAIVVPAFSIIVASTVTGLARRRGDKLDGCGALKMVCYLSALAIPWAVMVGGTLIATYSLRELGYTGPGFDRTYTLMWTIVGVALIVWYWIAGSRAYEACRWANT
ncbi:MAG: hypothetical protein HQ546_10295 [Planctomycetes bacterium]|nr:hypothetical protein [Planctomycetota bacterium]